MFEKAAPVWVKDRETEVHMTVQFKAVCAAASQAMVRIATSGTYRLTVNGTFVAYGPARAGKGHFRMDEIDVSRLMDREDNVVVLEVCGYNACSFYIQHQPSFLQAEVVANGQPVAWTGEHFTARVHPFLRQKTQRYSFQRPMMESYNITGADTYLTDTCPGTEPVAQTETKIILPRLVPYPQYEVIEAQPLFSGVVRPTNPMEYHRDRSSKNVHPETLTGFPIPELEVFPTDECQRMAFIQSDTCTGGTLAADTYTTYKFPYDATGMLKFRVTCEAPLTLYVLFDELLLNGKLELLRTGHCANIMRFDLCAGVHDLQVFEVYTMQYVQMIAIGGACTVEDMSMVEYKHPPIEKVIPAPTPALKKIAAAAVETYRQNAVDVFTDCPSRERAGWLCDSFFTGRVEYLLTGKTLVETNFLENFLHEERYKCLPEGMFPMCYPADHWDKAYIPQWALWLVLELKEYRERSGNEDLIARYQPRIENLFKYFEGYENEDGLLESLGGWNFVEWSKANELTKDVNYPTNMLYAAALRAATDLYGNQAYAQKAEAVAQTVREQSFDGTFFVDNALRKEGKLVLSGERTEVCQYYAFFCGIATAESHGELLDTMIRDFGPQRKDTGKWPQIYEANAFIGNYLRLDILTQYGYRREVLENIEGFFLDMAERTGTLWEKMNERSSCNHGFASHVLCWLDRLAK